MKFITGEELGTKPAWAGVTWFDGKSTVMVEWQHMQSLLKSGTATIQFAGMRLADDLTVNATFSVHPVGEDFEPYMIAINVDDVLKCVG